MRSVGAVIQSKMNCRAAPRVAIRADASIEIGTGHIRRCQSLATALRNRGAEVRFACRDFGFNYESILGEQPSVLATPSGIVENDDHAPPHARWLGVTQLQDSNDFIIAINQWKPDWVLVDNYAIDERWHKLVRGALGCRIAVVDDLADRLLDADLVVDHNWHEDHGSKYSRRLLRPSVMAAGPRYALIDQFYSSATRYEFRDDVRSIGIFMGGTDAINASAMALQAVEEVGFLGDIEIATTSANPNLAHLHSMANDRSKTLISVDMPNLAAFFARHDLQIGAGGGALWERFCIGAPSIVIATAENQYGGIEALEKKGLILGVQHNCLPPILKALETALSNPRIRLSMAEQSQLLVDGLGADRVAQRIVPLRSLRTANVDDAIQAFHWRNALSVRKLSNNKEEIDAHGHLIWWQNAIKNPNRILLIFELGEVPVGVLRYDLTGNEALVSVYLDPQKVNLGLGHELLLMGEEWLGDNDSGIARLIAEIHDDNESSTKAFSKAGFIKFADGCYDRIISCKTNDTIPALLSGVEQMEQI